MIEYKAYHKKSLGKPRRGRAVRRKGREKGARGGEVRLRHVLPVAAAILAVALVGAAGAAVYSWLGHSRIFSVQVIDVNPCDHVSRDEVAGILHGVSRGNIWTLSTSEIGRLLLDHPYVREVSVRKSFPDKLVVRVRERKPVAMINLDSLYYVDELGEIFKRLTAYDPKGYPIVTGFARADLAAKDPVSMRNLKRTIDLLQCAESGVLRENISEAHFDAQDGFT
ncbi:MAG: cell division protein FtsQ/DivIB, partial [Gemmatimonadota bacterium]